MRKLRRWQSLLELLLGLTILYYPFYLEGGNEVSGLSSHQWNVSEYNALHFYAWTRKPSHHLSSIFLSFFWLEPWSLLVADSETTQWKESESWNFYLEQRHLFNEEHPFDFQ